MGQSIQEAFQTVANRSPLMHPWGYFHYADGPAAAGGGVGCFAWFGSQEEMLEFIAGHQVDLCPGPCTADSDKVRTAVRFTIDELQAGNIGTVEALRALNEALKSFSQIEWWGMFGELVMGEDDFAQKVRAWFRESRDRPPDTSPIEGDELEDFAASLAEYGF